MFPINEGENICDIGDVLRKEVMSFKTDTSGEKTFEEFYTKDEDYEIDIHDSLGFINLITAIEENIDDELDLVVTIIGEKSMSKENSPFQTVGTLIEYLQELVNEEN
mgnify:CR=1 FL=1